MNSRTWAKDLSFSLQIERQALVISFSLSKSTLQTSQNSISIFLSQISTSHKMDLLFFFFSKLKRWNRINILQRKDTINTSSNIVQLFCFKHKRVTIGHNLFFSFWSTNPTVNQIWTVIMFSLLRPEFNRPKVHARIQSSAQFCFFKRKHDRLVHVGTFLGEINKAKKKSYPNLPFFYWSNLLIEAPSMFFFFNRSKPSKLLTLSPSIFFFGWSDLPFK